MHTYDNVRWTYVAATGNNNDPLIDSNEFILANMFRNNAFEYRLEINHDLLSK